ncbi:MAG: hypothetical protein ACTSX7_09445 [Alphaproteobacteria bacterium]
MSKARALKVALAVVALPLLSACAAPLSVTVLSFAAGGLSYATTGKSMTDNYLSHFAKADCAMHRIMVKNTPICIIQPETALAEASADPALAAPIYLAGGADDSVIFSDEQ